MKILTQLGKTSSNPPLGLMIGSFDGVHLGHRLLLKTLSELTGPKGTKAVITFSNHPSLVLKKQPTVLSICSPEHKIELFEEAGVNLLFLLKFTLEFASQSYVEFLTHVKDLYPFQYLVVGKGDAFGKGRQGDETHIKELSKKLHFEAHYIEKLKIDGELVSSGRIRQLIQAGDLKKAAKFLGRPYSIYGLSKSPGVCLPPDGIYDVTIGNVKAQATIKNGHVHLNREELAGQGEIIFGEKHS